MGPFFRPSYPWTLNRSTFWFIHKTTIWSLCLGQDFGPMKVQNLDLGLKVLILQEGPHRSMKDHIGTMVMFYIRSDEYTCIHNVGILFRQQILPLMLKFEYGGLKETRLGSRQINRLINRQIWFRNNIYMIFMSLL